MMSPGVPALLAAVLRLAVVGVLIATAACDEAPSSDAGPPSSGVGAGAPATGAGAAPSGGAAAAGVGTAGADVATGGAPAAGSRDAGTTDAATARLDAAPFGDAGAGSADAGAIPIDLPLGASEMFPLPGADGLCNDPPLRIGFGEPPTLGTRGRVAVWDDDQPAAPVAVVDLGAGVQSEGRGGREFEQAPHAYLDGDAAVFVLLPGALERGRRYHVTIEEGVLSGPDGPVVVDDATTWSFRTAATGPVDPTRLSVGLDGTAPLCTVQGAVDAVPEGNRVPTTIEIGEGSFFGLVHWSDKSALTLRGGDREGTRILGTNNNDLNPSTRTRPLFSVESSSDVTIEKLTIHNLTPQGGSQAEALAFLPCDRCIVRDANVLSLQDTLLWTGRVYAEDCLIAGNVDFVWGSGAAFFQSCEIRTVGRSGYIVQSRNDATGYGYVFVDSRLTSDDGVAGVVLARIDAAVYPASHVAYVDCEMGPHIAASGWTVSNPLFGSSLRFWEYGSKDPSGAPISTSGRSPYSRQLSASEAASMRDPTVVLGGWSPR